jgi:leucyl/phenylalanyl-tRNA--protein transferase
MPIFELSRDVAFPDTDLTDPSGILAVGGDLSSARLLLAYRSGIFPWFNEGDPIVWWSPDPRTVLYPEELKVSHSMKKVLRNKTFSVTADEDFESVILQCKAQKRPGQRGTWITNDMVDAYVKLHRLGYAHSFEVWKGESLAGGLYGVSIGRFFAGESMFSKVSNASKVAFIALAKTLQQLGFPIVDCQVHTNHLASLGAREIMPR